MTRVENSAHEHDSCAPRSDSLTNHCVLVTRPQHQQAELISALESHGAKTIAVPLLQIGPPSTGEHAATLRRSLLELDLFDTLIFISTNAVRAGVAAIEDYWPQFPVGIQVVAIGPSTAVLARAPALRHRPRQAGKGGCGRSLHPSFLLNGDGEVRSCARSPV